MIVSASRSQASTPSVGDYAEYHRRWSLLVDAVQTQQPIVLTTDRQIVGNLRSLPADHWTMAGIEFTADDIAAIWKERYGTLMVELASWIKHEESEYD